MLEFKKNLISISLLHFFGIAGDKARRSTGTVGHREHRSDYSALLGAYEECLRASEGIRFKKAAIESVSGKNPNTIESRLSPLMY